MVGDLTVSNAGWSLMAATGASDDEFVRMRGYQVALNPPCPPCPPCPPSLPSLPALPVFKSPPSFLVPFALFPRSALPRYISSSLAHEAGGDWGEARRERREQAAGSRQRDRGPCAVARMRRHQPTDPRLRHRLLTACPWRT